jgi:hypothetical protein
MKNEKYKVLEGGWEGELTEEQFKRAEHMLYHCHVCEAYHTEDPYTLSDLQKVLEEES